VRHNVELTSWPSLPQRRGGSHMHRGRRRWKTAGPRGQNYR